MTSPVFFILPLLCMLLLSPALPLLARGGETHPPALYSASPCLSPWHVFSFTKQRGWSGDAAMPHFLLPFCLVIQAVCCPAWEDLLLCQWTSSAPDWRCTPDSTRCIVTVWWTSTLPLLLGFILKYREMGENKAFFAFFFSFCQPSLFKQL